VKQPKGEREAVAMSAKKPQVMFGPLPTETEMHVARELGKLGTYVGSLQTVVGDTQSELAFDNPPVHITVDYYIDASDVTHVVVGVLSGDGSYWEILSDTPIPTVAPTG
jgi:hypothetical protein